ncbi:MAG: helix-turn-helix domain-containing protein [bacterium]|nr:helix-turn-helix domain-containing protein [bacterium]
MSSADAASTPGSMIAAARKRRGLTLDTLAERTKIPATMLAALEADEFHRLSGPLYARSFLRSCAAELGLDVADVFAAYEKHGGEPARAPGAAPPAPDPVRIRRVGLPWGAVVASVLLLVAAAFVAVRFVGRDGAAPPAAANARPDRAGAAEGRRDLVQAGAAETGGVSTPAVAAGDAVGAAPAGVPGLRFSDGRAWPVVARLSLAGPGAVSARCDRESGFTEVEWPGPGGAPAVPQSGVVAGRAYADGSGLVIYWGAVGRVRLRLGAGAQAALTVNGEPWPLAAPPGGDEIVVDVHGGTGLPN